jgi:thioredoxin 1
MNVNDANFKEVLGAPLAIVDFWSPQCGYCVQFTPIFEAAAGRYGGQILMVKAEVSEAKASAAKYGIQGLPTLVFMKNGQVVNKIEGAMSAQDFQAEIVNFLGTTGTASASPLSAGKLVGSVTLAAVVAGTAYLILK